MKRSLIGLSLVLSLVSLTLFGAGLGLAQTTGLAVTVIRAPFGASVADAVVSAGAVRASTDANGRAWLALPAGVYDLRVEARGYIGMTERSVELSALRANARTLAMLPESPSAEEDAEISARLWAANEHNQEAALADAPGGGVTPSGVTDPPETLRVLMPDGSVVVMPLEEYLKGVVPAEVPASWPTEALRAQAVAARSYAATRHAHDAQGADVCTTTHCQVWSTTQYESTSRAIADTRGVVARYAGQIIYAFFFAHCNGTTRNSEDIGWNPVPYCRSVVCPCGYDFYYGHGVGMCQQGARAMALQGYAYADIVEHYYTGTVVSGPPITPTPTPTRVPTASVTPASGDTSTEFTYAATWVSATDERPLLAYVVIDGRAHSLLPAWSVPDVAPGLRTDEPTYVLRTRLAAGQHSHRFVFVHADGGLSTVPAEGEAVGPTVALVSGPTPTPTMPAWQTVDIAASTQADWADGLFENVALSVEQDGELRLSLDAALGVYTSAVISTALEYVGVAATWYAHIPSDATLVLELRRGYAGGAWGPWTPLPPSEDDARALPASPAGRLYSSDVIFGEGDALQYRVTLSGVGASPLLRHLRLVCIDTRSGPSAPQPAAPAGSYVIRRGDWGADPALLHWSPGYATPKALILHHTAGATAGVDPAACVRALYYYHSVIREWGDIGYNYLVDALGNVYEGRAGGAGALGAHSGAYDALTQGIALLGDLTVLPPSAAQQASLVKLLADLCSANELMPTDQTLLLGRQLPVVMGHAQCAATRCPGDALTALLTDLRTATLLAMGYALPQVVLQSPATDATVRGVLVPSLVITGPVSSVAYLVDGTPAATRTTAPHTWRWSTLGWPDGVHTLRVLVDNTLGSAWAEVSVRIDNSAPTGSVSVPPWSTQAAVPFVLASADATTVQFSNAWVWEGEALYFGPGTGRRVVDPDALNGHALLGRAGMDAAGAWFGPFTCALPWPATYEAAFRVKTSARTPDLALATLDVADDRGTRRYALLERLYADGLARGNAYDEVSLTFDYGAQPPTCAVPGQSDGLEFRTAWLGQQDLYLDRVTLYSAPQPLQSVVTWTVTAVEGSQPVTVRLRDVVGNPHDTTVTVRLDWTPPRWLDAGGRTQRVLDPLSGLDPASARCAFSADGGTTWSDWLALEPACAPGDTQPVQLVAPDPLDTFGLAATHVRFAVADLAGNLADSPPHALAEPTARDILLPLILR